MLNLPKPRPGALSGRGGIDSLLCEARALAHNFIVYCGIVVAEW
jgi:hypothetical protein